jgi:CubicO group peptidase (beta-lactamase class C family)
MFTASEPWPVAVASEKLHLATLGLRAPDVQPDPDTWIAGLGSLPLLCQPGERWLYNTGASVLGVLLARAGGEPLADVFETRIFAPLGMRDTSFWMRDTDRLATAYRASPDGLVVVDEPTGSWSRPPLFADAIGPPLHGRRPPRVRANAARRRRERAQRRSRARDDERSADGGAEGGGRPRA